MQEAADADDAGYTIRGLPLPAFRLLHLLQRLAWLASAACVGTAELALLRARRYTLPPFLLPPPAGRLQDRRGKF